MSSSAGQRSTTSQQGDEAACGTETGSDAAALAGTSSASSLGFQLKELDDEWPADLEASPGYVITERLAIHRVSSANSLEDIWTAYTLSVDDFQKYVLTSLKQELTEEKERQKEQVQDLQQILNYQNQHQLQVNDTEQLLQAAQLNSGRFDLIVRAFQKLLSKLVKSVYGKTKKHKLFSEFYNSSAKDDLFDLDHRIIRKSSEFWDNYELEVEQLLLEMNRQTPDKGTEVGVARANSSDNKDLPHPSK